MSILSDKQARFTRCIGLLIIYADSIGLKLTFGDAYRNPKYVTYGHPQSCHKSRLAVDFNLFDGGTYLSDGADPRWEKLGIYWEQLDPDARWGGRFNDANHFSFIHMGVK